MMAESVMSKPENPPAFPIAQGADTQVFGMSLRDYFAAQAMAGICSHRMNADIFRRYLDGKHDGREAVVAYAIADEMIRVRSGAR